MRVLVRMMFCLALIGSLLTVVNVVSDDSDAEIGRYANKINFDPDAVRVWYPNEYIEPLHTVQEGYSFYVYAKTGYENITVDGEPYVANEFGVNITPSMRDNGIVIEASKINYQINYNVSDVSGTTPPSPPTFQIGSNINVSTVTFYRYGYDVLGWNTQENGSGMNIDPGNYLVDSDFIEEMFSSSTSIELYPRWSLINYSVTFDANEGSGQLPDNLTNRTVETGAVIPDISLTRIGYHCSVWNTRADGSGQDISPGELELNGLSIPLYYPSSTLMKLYPKWIANSYSIVYNASNINGSTPDPIPSFQIGTNITISPATFYRNGYDFLGWNTSENGSGAILDPGDHSVNAAFIESVFGEGTTANLYPIWSIKTYSISLSTEYGTVSGDGWSADNAIFRKSFNVESDEVTISSPSTDDRFHSFVCWEDQSGNTVSSIPNGSYGDVALTAVWKNVDYALKLNINGVTYDRTFTIDDDMPVPDCEDGFEFVGWFYTDDNGNEVRFISMSQMYENMSIYAVFEPTSDDPVVTIAIVSSLIVFFAAVMFFAFRKE